MQKQIRVIMVVMALTGCTPHSSYNRHFVSEELESRAGSGIRTTEHPGETRLPDGISLEDGITEDEAVSIALWNNAQFQVDLAEMGLIRADLVQAGLLRNPILSFLFPAGPKQLEATVSLPLEALWQRPRRVAIAKLDVESVAQNLIRSGLNLAKETRVMHADLVQAQAMADLIAQDGQLLEEIAVITQNRFIAGDISEYEAGLAQIEALKAQDRETQMTLEAATLTYRTYALLGLPDQVPPLTPVSPSNPLPVEADLTDLVMASLVARPDMRAAELAIETAEKQAGLEKWSILKLVAILDINGKGSEGFEAGPGVQADLPILNQNNGNVTRANAQLERAVRQYVAVRHRIMLDVQESYARYRSAEETFARWHDRIVPSQAEALSRAESTHAAGETSYLSVLLARRGLLEARMREANAVADLRRTSAQLQYSLGRKLEDRM